MHLGVGGKRSVAAWFLLAPLALGCGGDGDLGRVSGNVTMDGAPLPDALVTFSPTAPGGSPSAGRTDSSGNYNLTFSRDTQGAVIGEHKVTITTYSEGDPGADPPDPPTPEKVPARYNIKTELKKTVESGSNTIDFPLESSGEIISPADIPEERPRDGCCGCCY